MLDHQGRPKPPRTRAELLRAAEVYDALELEESDKIDKGRGLDSMCSYFQRCAQHYRRLAIDAPDVPSQ